jgi:hypothetical protein
MFLAKYITLVKPEYDAILVSGNQTGLTRKFLMDVVVASRPPAG